MNELIVPFSSVLFLFLGLTTGNFIFQASCEKPQWDVAAERSFFQFVALFALWILSIL